MTVGLYSNYIDTQQTCAVLSRPFSNLSAKPPLRRVAHMADLMRARYENLCSLVKTPFRSIGNPVPTRVRIPEATNPSSARPCAVVSAVVDATDLFGQQWQRFSDTLLAGLICGPVAGAQGCLR